MLRNSAIKTTLIEYSKRSLSDSVLICNIDKLFMVCKLCQNYNMMIVEVDAGGHGLA